VEQAIDSIVSCAGTGAYGLAPCSLPGSLTAGERAEHFKHQIGGQ